MLDFFKTGKNPAHAWKFKGDWKAVYYMNEKDVDEKGWKYDDFLVSSFNHGELKNFKELNPKIKTGILVEEIPNNFMDFAEKADAYSINIPIKYATHELVENAHSHGLKVYVWSANETEEIQKAKSLNVDYICSNFPDKI